MSSNLAKAYYATKQGYGIGKTRLKNITILAGDLKNKEVLDVGCGNGFLGSHLKSLGAKRADGCDISSMAITEASEVLDVAKVCDFETESIVQALNNKQYDIVVATELIEHLFHPGYFLENIKPLIKPGGFLILTTPNLLVLSNRIRMLLGEFEYTKTGLLDEGHIHFFTYNSLMKELIAHKFEVIAEENVYHPKIPKFIATRTKNMSVFQSVFKCAVKNV